jgi:hypothetical protein
MLTVLDCGFRSFSRKEKFTDFIGLNFQFFGEKPYFILCEVCPVVQFPRYRRACPPDCMSEFFNRFILLNNPSSKTGIIINDCITFFLNRLKAGYFISIELSSIYIHFSKIAPSFSVGSYILADYCGKRNSFVYKNCGFRHVSYTEM